MPGIDAGIYYVKTLLQPRSTAHTNFKRRWVSKGGDPHALLRIMLQNIYPTHVHINRSIP